MGEKTLIEWTDATWNPWRGCIKVSSGCKNCYMYREQTRFNANPADVIRSSPKTFNSPQTKRRKCKNKWVIWRNAPKRRNPPQLPLTPPKPTFTNKKGLHMKPFFITYYNKAEAKRLMN